MNLHHRTGLDADADISPPVIYKHGIILFRSVFSLLRVLPSWKFYKRLKRKIGGVNRNGHLGIQLRVRSCGSTETDRNILGFGKSPTFTQEPNPHLLVLTETR
jgi:autophagy-related protein 13